MTHPNRHLRVLLNFALIGVLFAAVLLLGTLPARSQTTGTAPILGATSHFQVGASPRRLDFVNRLAFGDLRDGVLWRDVEISPGQYRFDTGSAANLMALSQRGLLGSVTLYPNTPDRQDGATVFHPQDIDAFGRYGGAVAAQFPDSLIEVANEFNGSTFVSGKVKQMSAQERARLHAAMLAALVEHGGIPKERIIGGAAHSIPGGYLWEMLDAGAAKHMSAIALHPYDTAPEALPRQLGVLRRHPAMADLAIDVTEFGNTQPGYAADYFWRSYCSMAMANVRRVKWYPLEPRNDGYSGVFNEALTLTGVGRALTHARAKVMGRAFVEFRPDPFTYGCVFDQKLAVIWGAARAIQVRRDGLTLRSADFRLLDGVPDLSRDRVLVIEATDGKPLDLWSDIELAPIPIVADSFDQFNFPPEGKDARDGDSSGFDRFLRINGQDTPLITCPGQQKGGVPWIPYLCSAQLPDFFLHDRGMALVLTGRAKVDVVHRHHAARDMTVTASLTLSLNPQSTDGFSARLVLDGQEVAHADGLTKGRYDFDPLDVPRGAQLDVIIDAGPTKTGDVGRMRITLSESAFQAVAPAR